MSNSIDPSFALFHQFIHLIGASNADNADVMTALSAACAAVVLCQCGEDEEAAKKLVKRRMAHMVISAFPAVVAMMKAGESAEAILESMKATKQ